MLKATTILAVRHQDRTVLAGDGTVAGGTVSFSDGTTPLGTCTLSGATCSITIATLTTASHAITARYAGDATRAPSSGTGRCRGPAACILV